jgi:hypothetical protein
MVGRELGGTVKVALDVDVHLSKMFFASRDVKEMYKIISCHIVLQAGCACCAVERRHSCRQLIYYDSSEYLSKPGQEHQGI